MKNAQRIGLWLGSIAIAGPLGFWLALANFDSDSAVQLFRGCAALAGAWANSYQLNYSAEFDRLLLAARQANSYAWWSAVLSAAGAASVLGLILEWGASRKTAAAAPGGRK